MRYALCIVLLAVCAGCTNKELATATEKANVLSGGYIKHLETTTSEQDKAHIRSMDAEILAADAAVRGTAAAQATRALVIPPAAPATIPGDVQK